MNTEELISTMQTAILEMGKQVKEQQELIEHLNDKLNTQKLLVDHHEWRLYSLESK